VDSIAFRIDYVFVKRCTGLPGDTVHFHGTFKYSGAVYVPQKGDTLYLDDAKIDLYRTVIAYETKEVLPTDYHIFLNN
jgi:signal peptidase I